jgi:sterol desaturase/sphingolipid hydroxylase (fatty acid hydroxylase superfamily)
MQLLSRRTLILISVSATAALYAGFALLLGSNDSWLHSVVGANAPVTERLAIPLRRAVRDAAFVVAVGMALYLAYRVLANGWLATRRIATERATRDQIACELLLFGNALFAMGLLGMVYAILRESGYSKRYDDIAQYGWAYAVFSVGVFVVLSDAWAYFWHLAYHRFNTFYRVSHHVHHLSVVTTPWTTFQVSPIELLPPTVFSALMVATLPLATPVLVLINVASIVLTMIAHGGIEVFPRGTATHPIGRWLVTPTYHQMHHEDGERNIALYFNWWDRILGTKNAAYEARFEKVTAGAQPPARTQLPIVDESELARR